MFIRNRVVKKRKGKLELKDRKLQQYTIKRNTKRKKILLLNLINNTNIQSTYKRLIKSLKKHKKDLNHHINIIQKNLTIKMKVIN